MVASSNERSQQVEMAGVRKRVRIGIPHVGSFQGMFEPAMVLVMPSILHYNAKRMSIRH